MITVYNQTNELLANLDNINNPNISEEINGEYTFAFQAIRDDKVEYINTNNYIEVDDNYFDIMNVKSYRNNTGLFLDVSCDHVSYRLLDYELDSFEYSGTPQQILTYLLQDTIFNVGTVDIESLGSINIKEATNKKAILYELATQFQGELKFDKFTISLLSQRGSNHSVEFRVGSNLNGIYKNIDKRKKVNGQPTISYGVDLVEVGECNGYQDIKDLFQVKLGDTVRVIDEEQDINEEIRVLKYEYNPLEKINSTVELSNVLEDITSPIVNIQRSGVFKETLYNGVQISNDFGFRATRSDGKVVTTMNATEGISIENENIKVFSVDEYGNIVANKGTYNEITANNMVANEMRTSNTSSYIVFHDQYAEFFKNGRLIMQLGFDTVNAFPTVKLINSDGNVNGIGITGAGALNILGNAEFNSEVDFYGTTRINGDSIATRNWVRDYVASAMPSTPIE